MRQDRSWLFNGSVENETRLKPLCQQVEARFNLPARRLCRYFATSEDCDFLSNRLHYRGFQVPYSQRELLPKYLFHCFFLPFEETPAQAVQAFDNLIYIRHSTCADTTGFVITYAHELQHFVQHATMPRLLVVNEVLRQNLKPFEPTAITTDIPSEREANIVSKRAAEIVCGVEDVRRFAEERVAVMEKAGEQDEKARWIFFRDVPSSTEYDYLADTLRLVEKWKTKIDFGMDVTQPDWWLEP
jgi:hypothetical protein